jgi:iron(III) transport system ATP-binding protein
VYVTHDQIEALAMSDVIGVMRQGKFEQVGKAQDIYNKPASRFVADFIGTSNFMEGKISRKSAPGSYLVDTNAGLVEAPSTLDLAIGAEVIVAVRPEHIGIEAGKPSGVVAGRLAGRVRAQAFLGEVVDHIVEVGPMEIQVRCHPSLSFATGSEVTLVLSQDTCSLIPAGSAH